MTASVLIVTPSSAGAHSIIRAGDTGFAVLSWQALLNHEAEVQGRVPEALIDEDGIFGHATERATKLFQRKNSLPVDGVVGNRERISWLANFITCCGAIKPTIGLGSYATNVGFAQQILNKWLRSIGSAPLTIDLHFGPATEAAVKRYQQAQGLVVDGVIGRDTWGSFLGWPEV